MPRQSEPHMHDPSDKEIHRKEGVDPYPVPNSAEVVGSDQGDLEDPREAGADTTHDRGKAVDGKYTDATDARKKVLKDDGDYEAWRHGQTQETPAKKH